VGPGLSPGPTEDSCLRFVVNMYEINFSGRYTRFTSVLYNQSLVANVEIMRRLNMVPAGH